MGCADLHGLSLAFLESDVTYNQQTDLFHFLCILRFSQVPWHLRWASHSASSVSTHQMPSKRHLGTGRHRNTCYCLAQSSGKGEGRCHNSKKWALMEIHIPWGWSLWALDRPQWTHLMLTTGELGSAVIPRRPRLRSTCILILEPKTFILKLNPHLLH